MESQHTKFQARDVSVEAYLDAGTYIVYVRILKTCVVFAFVLMSF